MKKLLLLTAFVLVPTAVAYAAGALAVCCAWNLALADGDLTYKISGGNSVAQATVRAAIEDWEVVTGLTLTEITGRTKANIEVKFKEGGGRIAGMALRKFDGSGFINSVSLSISGKGFGLPNSQAIIAEITRHEVGHALGLGHADFDDLMGPFVGGTNTISACDISGVREANHWKLVDGDAAPHIPHVTSIGC